jgi:Flp pilus assembly protein TadG
MTYPAPSTARTATGSIRRLLRRFRREENAASAVEFAIISIPFLGILMAIFETTFVLFNAEMVDAVTANVSRQLMTGQIQTNGQSCAQQKVTFQNLICPTSGARPSTALPSNFDCSKVIIDVRQSSAVNNFDESNSLYQNPNQAQFSPASQGQNNIIRVIYPMQAIMPIISGFNNSSISGNRAGQVQYNGAWTHILMGISVFRTEPYGGGGGGTC